MVLLLKGSDSDDLRSLLRLIDPVQYPVDTITFVQIDCNENSSEGTIHSIHINPQDLEWHPAEVLVFQWGKLASSSYDVVDL